MKKNFRRILMICLTGVILASAAACSRSKDTEPPAAEPAAIEMNIPQTDAVTYKKGDAVDVQSWADAEPSTAFELISKDIEMAAGGTIKLMAIKTESEPVAAADELTSFTEDFVLNSSGTQLGDGTLSDLVQNELYRWTEDSGFTDVEYNQPEKISENRYMIHLLLKSEDSITEQVVVFTGLDSSLASIDRLWRPIKDADITSNPEFDAVANSLISDTAV